MFSDTMIKMKTFHLELKLHLSLSQIEQSGFLRLPNCSDLLRIRLKCVILISLLDMN
jgi:hypothetical protein